MARRPPPAPAAARGITKGYSEMLAKMVKDSGLRPVDVKKFIPKSQFHRVVNRKGGAPISAAMTLRAAMQRLRPELDIPPPVVAVEGAAHYDWLHLGTELFHKHPDLYASVLERTAKAVQALVEAKRLNERAMADLSAMPPANGEE